MWSLWKIEKVCNFSALINDLNEQILVKRTDVWVDESVYKSSLQKLVHYVAILPS